MNQHTKLEDSGLPTNDHAAENAARNAISELLNVANVLLQVDNAYSNRAVRQALGEAREAAENLESHTSLIHGFNSRDNVQAWATRAAIVNAIEATRGPANCRTTHLRRRIARALQLHFIAADGGTVDALWPYPEAEVGNNALSSAMNMAVCQKGLPAKLVKDLIYVFAGHGKKSSNIPYRRRRAFLRQLAFHVAEQQLEATENRSDDL